MEQFKMRIGEKWRGASDGRTFASFNPYTGKIWAEMPRGTAGDVDDAVRAAHSAFKIGPWATMTATQRGMVLHKIGDAIAANAEELTHMEVQDAGKLKAETLKQMQYLPQWFYYYGGLADKIQGEVTPFDKPGIFHYSTFEPLGVVATIVPWTSPLLLAVWKIAPALAAGNTVVIKPSEFSSASSIVFARLCEEAGVPPGVVNIVTGLGKEVGESLAGHRLVARVAFTGSEDVGRHVYANAARSLKRVSLELGGKSANIVFEDADLDDAVKGAVTGIFASTGQSCIAGSRLLVHSSIHDEFVNRMVKLMQNVCLGDPMSPDTNMGPLSTPRQLEKTLYYIDVAKHEGARCVLGGGRSTRLGTETGLFVEPTIFVDVSNDMRIAQEEVVGPIAAVIKFDTEDEAIAIANDTNFGLAAGVWTSDLRRAITVPRQLEAGSVWVNAYGLFSYLAPFGGLKVSGFGRENGIRAIYEYLEAKSVFINPASSVGSPFVPHE